MNTDFKELLKTFNEHGVKYLVVGGYAVMKHSEPRFTKDLDIWVEASLDNAEKVFQSLKSFGAPLSNLTVADFAEDGFYQMGRPPARIDILMGLTGLDFRSAWSNRVEGNYGEVKTQFLSIDDLIINKREAGRPQDLMDVENLQLARKRNLAREQVASPQPELRPESASKPAQEKVLGHERDKGSDFER